MSVPIKPIILIVTLMASLSARAQLMGLGFESNISLKQDDINLIHQTVDQQVHGKPVGTTASWRNPSTGNSGTIKLLRKFKVRNMHCEAVGYTLMTSAGAFPPEHYELDSCLQPDGTWRII
jgi:surface antigen